MGLMCYVYCLLAWDATRVVRIMITRPLGTARVLGVFLLVTSGRRGVIVSCHSYLYRHGSARHLLLDRLDNDHGIDTYNGLDQVYEGLRSFS